MRVVVKRGLAVLAALPVFLSVGVVAAQNAANSANGFRISPVRSELTIEKGKKGTVTVTVENPTEVATTAKPIINDFIASDSEDGEPRLILDDKVPSPKNDFKSLVQPINEVTLGPKEKKDITVNLSVPNDARSGGYYGAIRFIPSTVNNAGNVSLTASVGTIVLVTVPGNLTQQLDLAQLGAGQDGKYKGFMTSGDVQVLVRLKNSGDIHVRPFGKVVVKDMFGKTVKNYELNGTKSNILPDSTRKFADSIGKPKGFGRYTIEANLSAAQGSGDLITGKASFWYVPTWALVLLAVILAAIGGGVYILVRKVKGGGKHRTKK